MPDGIWCLSCFDFEGIVLCQTSFALFWAGEGFLVERLMRDAGVMDGVKKIMWILA